ncbi:hypothetical protein V3C99_005020 [Haemonchus contortus]
MATELGGSPKSSAESSHHKNVYSNPTVLVKKLFGQIGIHLVSEKN